jgi:hypothetical protein
MIIHPCTGRVIEGDHRLQLGTVSYDFLQDVTHPSTDRAQCCLTSVTGQDRRSQRGTAGHKLY